MDSLAWSGVMPEKVTSVQHPTTEPFATCVAALCRHVHDPETALNIALKDLALSFNTDAGKVLQTPDTVLAHAAERHGYADLRQFRADLIPAIQKRALEICGQDIFYGSTH
jgi:hypothetical protein